eukprot:gene4179-6484_t
MEEDEKTASWKDFGLDARLLQGVQKMRFKAPTLIQASAIPLAMAGKDILARASTGSGKTAAYSLPMCHKLLATAARGKRAKAAGAGSAARGMVLVPSKELCYQVAQHFRELLKFCEGELQVADFGNTEPADWSGGRCEICVATPATAQAYLKEKLVDLSQLEVCVIDEADALLSQPVVRRLRCAYPATTQSFLMSATLSPGVLELKRLILNRPVVVKLEEEDDDQPTDAAPLQETGASAPLIDQRFVPVYDASEAHCLLYALLRLGYMGGKTLIFVDSIDKAYKLKIFLDRFAYRAAVLNAEVPVNSRNHIVAQFNTGEFHLLIATDESLKREVQQQQQQQARQQAAEPAAAAPSKKKKKKKQPAAPDAPAGSAPPAAAAAAGDYGVSRGIDFREVACVVNFDTFEGTEMTEAGCKSYVHRIGRTGRAGKHGLAVTFVTHDDATDRGWVSYLNDYLQSRGQSITLHPIADGEKKTEAFKLLYRTDSVLTSITKREVKSAKVQELVQEAITSEALKRHFAANPKDLAALKHLAPQSKAQRTQASSLSYIPDYISTTCPSLEETTQSAVAHPTEEDSSDSGDAAKLPKTKKRRRRDPLQLLKPLDDADAEPPAKKKRIIRRKVVRKSPAQP